jgi:hypothetical protein
MAVSMAKSCGSWWLADLFAEAHIGGADRKEPEREADSDEVVHDATTLPLPSGPT